MSAFAVGEVDIGQNHVVNVDLNGMECVIVGSLQIRLGRDGGPEGKLSKANQYLVQWADGRIWNAAPQYLRKRRPPASNESAHRQAMLDCIERAKRVSEVAA